MKDINLRKVVLIVDDDPNIVALVKEALRDADYILLDAGSMQDAEAMLGTRKPGLVILDWLLPDGSGVDLLARMRQSSSFKHIPVIMLTSLGNEQDMVKGFDQGADDYMTKPFSHVELAKRVEAIMRRLSPFMEEEIALFDDFVVNLSQKQLVVENRVVGLGNVEFNLFMALYRHEGQVLSRDSLLSQVWGDDSFVYERTVDVHILRLRNHFGKKYEDMIQTVRGVGYKFSRDMFEKNAISYHKMSQPVSTRRQSVT